MFPEKIHRYIFLFGLLGLGFGMMIGAVPTSVPQIILLCNWLAEGKFKWKFETLKSNRLFWVLGSVFLLHVIGLIYTQNWEEGLKDVKTKAPLLLLPLVFFSTKPISLKEFYGVLYCFIVGCLANTAWCLLYSFVLHTQDVLRDTSRFMSHIRLGLYLNVAIVTCSYFGIKSQNNYKRSAWFLVAVYFVLVLYILGLASGLINFMILFLLGLCAIIYRQKLLFKLAGLVIFVIAVALVTNYISGIKDAQLIVKETPNNIPQQFSPSGRAYIHFEKNGQKENGNYIQINVQPEELQLAWKKQFPADSFNYEAKHNLQRYAVLIRYLASKGQNKDSAGFAQLNETDKRNIQKDISNYEYPFWSYLHKRTYELVNEYDEFIHHRFVNGHSLTMRLYFWKAGLHLAGKNLIAGVGTGDVQQELNKAYIETESPLYTEWFKRPHNQFLTITVALGIIGLILFFISIFYPAITLRQHLSKLYWPFFIIAFLSFFLEDTLETQAGCTFYAFFNTLFLSVAWFRKYST